MAIITDGGINAVVDVQEAAFWPALQNFLEGLASEARQMASKDFGSLDAYVYTSAPRLCLHVDNVMYEAFINQIERVNSNLPGSRVKITYGFYDDKDRHVIVEIKNVGSSGIPQGRPVALQQRWES